MADKYQEEILGAINYLVNNKISSIDRDKTVTATVVGVSNATTLEYKVSYNGGTMLAYAQEGTSYAKTASVYVLVPEGDFSKRKTIIGLASDTSAATSTYVSSSVNNYNRVGDNALSVPEGKSRWGLNSYVKEDYELIYKRGTVDSKFLKVDDSKLRAYLKDAEALLLQSTFQTALPREHRYSASGNYGISVVLAFNNGNDREKKYSAEHLRSMSGIDTTSDSAVISFIDKNKEYFVFSDFDEHTKDFLTALSNGFLSIGDYWTSWSEYTDAEKKKTPWSTYISGKSEFKNLISASTYTVGTKTKYVTYIGAYTDFVKNAASADELTRGQSQVIERVQEQLMGLYQTKIVAIWGNAKKDAKEKSSESKNLTSDFQACLTAFSAQSGVTTELLEDLASDVSTYLESTKIENSAFSEEKAKELLIDPETSQVKYVAYTIDSTNMLGSPFNYTQPTSQYNIYSIDGENFLYVDSVLLFSQDFVEETDTNRDSDSYNDIFFSEFCLYGLQTISATNGDYTLRLGTPYGAVFDTTEDKVDNEETALYAEATLTRLEDDLSDTAVFYWFSKDDRVTSSSIDYRAIAGDGWKYLEGKGSTKELKLLASENQAYENQYRCVVTYDNSLILKTDFTIYNTSCKMEIAINSNFPNNEFSFDRGDPELTCTLDGKSYSFDGVVDDDVNYTFSWSVTDANGDTTALNQTIKDINTALKSVTKYSERVSLTNQKAALDGVSFSRTKNGTKKEDPASFKKDGVSLGGADGNILVYPVKNISKKATFSCSVYKSGYLKGSAALTLANSTEVSATDYSIRITNGDQVFQYSESGVTPASERNTDPQEILPLECHFYDKNGLEVNTSTYTVKWKVPVESTMIVAPSSMTTNPANLIAEWYTESSYPLAIAENYDYQATHNQVTCIVAYKNQEYTQDTTLTFNKIGDNGTNGTDVVAKISPTDSPQGGKYLFAITETGAMGGGSVTTNVGSLEGNPLVFSLYNRGLKLTDLSEKSVTWTVAPKTSLAKHLGVTAGNKGGTLSWKTNSKGKYEDLVVRASVSYDASSSEDKDKSSSDNTGDTAGVSSKMTYRAFYPVPYINYRQKDKVNVKILRDETLKQVIYNSDGHNPAYNKNQGVKLEIDKLENFSGDRLRIAWSVEGGDKSNASTSAVRLSEPNPKNAAEPTSSAFSSLSTDAIKKSYAGETQNGTTVFSAMMFVIPADTYTGEYMNNNVVIRLYENDKADAANLVATIYVPVYMGLNTYSLASLNAWDGNHIEINEDGNYILAPQIGAGYKDKDNSFTGVVMGQAKAYEGTSNSETSNTGLLGYSGGKQSIFLDATTGNATFGLPEDQASQDNSYNEGRIELRPGGDSKIGNWTIGANAIYSARTSTGGGVGKDKGNINRLNINAKDADGNALLKDEYNGLDGKTSVDYLVSGSEIAIPHDFQGAVLSAYPAYLSVKGKPLTKNDISLDDSNTVLKAGDSLEIELDPNKRSLFSIYRHTPYSKNANGEMAKDKYGNGTDKWHRYPLVGINANGQFYTNAVENGESSMGIGFIGAFGASASDEMYVGGQFAYGGKNIFKFFTDNNESTSKGTTPLYLSSGFGTNNEYPRDVKMYGKTISLYGDSSSSTSKASAHYLTLNDTTIALGHRDNTQENRLLIRSTDKSDGNTLKNYLVLTSAASSVKLDKSLSVSLGETSSISITGSSTKTVGGSLSTTIKSISTKTVNKSATGTYGTDNGQVKVGIGGQDKDGVDVTYPFYLKKYNTAYKDSNSAALTASKVWSGAEIGKDGGLDVASQGTLNILSNNGTGSYCLNITSRGQESGVQILAKHSSSNVVNSFSFSRGTQDAYLQLKSSASNMGIFNLGSNLGSVSAGLIASDATWSMPRIMNNMPYNVADKNGNAVTINSQTNGKMVEISPRLFVDGVGIFNGTFDSANSFYGCSVFAKKGVLSNRYLLWANNGQAGDQSWRTWSTCLKGLNIDPGDTNETKDYHSNLEGSIKANNIEEILKWLLKEIEGVRKYAQNYADNAAKRTYNNATSYADTRANNVKSYVDGNFSKLGHNHDSSYVSKTDFNGHTHYLTHNPQAATNMAISYTLKGGTPEHYHEFRYIYNDRTMSPMTQL